MGFLDNGEEVKTGGKDFIGRGKSLLALAEVITEKDSNGRYRAEFLCLQSECGQEGKIVTTYFDVNNHHSKYGNKYGEAAINAMLQMIGALHNTDTLSEAKKAANPALLGPDQPGRGLMCYALGKPKQYQDQNTKNYVDKLDANGNAYINLTWESLGKDMTAVQVAASRAKVDSKLTGEIVEPVAVPEPVAELDPLAGLGL